MCATLPSMKSKMFATSMITNASRNRPKPSAQAAPTLMSTPISVSVLGWIRSATQRLMMPRSGNMQAAPMAPVKVMRVCAAIGSVVDVKQCTYNGGFRHLKKTRHSIVCPSTNSRSRSPGCPSSPGSICTSTRMATRFTSARRARCATGCATIWAPTAPIAKTDALLDEVVRLEVIVTDSVVEALALENNLIKQRTPKYNILLRDDKNYPYLQLTTNEAFPRVLVARGVERDGSFYAGPFMPAHFARKTMSLTHRLFGMRSCNEVITGKRGRPCLEYDIKRCIAPVRRHDLLGGGLRAAPSTLTRLFLEGKNDELVKTLRGADARRRRAASASRRRRSCAMRCARCRRCTTASRRWRPPSSAIATCSA